MTPADVRRVIEMEHRNSRHKATDNHRYTYIHLFCTRRLALLTMIMSLGWFTVSHISYGVLFNLGSMAGNLYVNGLFMGELIVVCSDAPRRIPHVRGDHHDSARLERAVLRPPRHAHDLRRRHQLRHVHYGPVHLSGRPDLRLAGAHLGVRRLRLFDVCLVDRVRDERRAVSDAGMAITLRKHARCRSATRPTDSAPCSAVSVAHWRHKCGT